MGLERMYRTQVEVATLPVARWLEEYCRPERFASACEACPDYGRVWSCPPGVPAAQEAFAPYQRVHVVGVKVIYDEAVRAAAVTPERTEELRQATYGKAKRVLLETLLELEKVLPGSWSVAAGRCELCPRCSRVDGLPCRMPERMRYSFSGFGFDLGRIAEELLGMELLWSPQGLPDYNVAVAAFLEKSAEPGGVELEQKYVVRDTRPWPVFQQEAVGLLRRLGCAAAPAEERNQRDTYYDTEDDAVLRAGCSLRVRRVGQAGVLTWKGPAEDRRDGLFARREEELPLFTDSLDGERERGFLRRCLAGLPGAGAGDLAPRVVVECLRRAVPVTGLDGDVYELAFDEVVYRTPEGRALGGEHQMELECKAGAGTRLGQLTEALERALPGLTPAKGSKYSRARAAMR